MKATEFRKLQSDLDNAGVLTHINRIGRNSSRRYEVVVNMELKKKYKTRRSAKNFIVKLLGGGVLRVTINHN